jgi:hypothetical protein
MLIGCEGEFIGGSSVEKREEDFDEKSEASISKSTHQRIPKIGWAKARVMEETLADE